MSIALLVMTDGRDEYLDRCIASADEHLRLTGDLARYIYDDTGDAAYRAHLAERYPSFTHFNVGPRQGFGGAIRAAWGFLTQYATARWVFHLEADFVFTRTVDLVAMAAVLNDRPHLVQMALRRQAWNDAEVAAGGVVELTPNDFHDRFAGEQAWLEHRLWFTTNPSLYRRSLCQMRWPSGQFSEGLFSRQLLTQGSPETVGEDIAFGYWGPRSSGVWVEHIGHERVGHGY